MYHLPYEATEVVLKPSQQYKITSEVSNYVLVFYIIIKIQRVKRTGSI